MKIKTTLLTLSMVAITACGGGGGGGGGSASPACVEKLNLFSEDPTNEVIIDDLRWSSSDTLGSGATRSNARATAYIKITARSSRCTGFLINNDTIMTNNHCVSKQSHVKNMKVTFQYTDKSKGKAYTCDKFIGTNRALDFSLVKCQGTPGKDFPKTVLAGYKADVNDPIYVVHQNCDYRNSRSCKPTQKYSEGRLLGSTSSNVEHNADTLPGSSGSPIFSADSHKVIAIHNAGRSYSNGGGMNYGVPMYKIVDYIQSKFPEVKLYTSSDRSPSYQTCD